MKSRVAEMSAIKLPVTAYRHAYELWHVRDAENSRIGKDLTEAQAKQIERALNLHDDLFDAVLMAAAIHCDPRFEYRWSTASEKVRAVLARATTINKSKP